MAAVARTTKVNSAAVARGSARVAAVARPVAFSPALPSVRSISKASSSSRSSSVVAQAVPVEVAQVAGEAGFIAGTSLTMFAITLVGLALGFVLLRVESLVEEGKL